MAQEAEALSRAISTAMFLMAPAPPEAAEKRVWDAATRQVITLKAAPVINPDLVGISSSGQGSGSSLLLGTSKSGKLVHFNTESGAADLPASPSGRAGGSLSSSSVRNSLTGYQWGSSSPSSPGAAAAGAGSSISRRSSTVGGPPCPAHPRPNCLDLQRQGTLKQNSTGASSPSAATAATGHGRNHLKSSTNGRSSSLELPLTDEEIKQLHQLVCSTDGSISPPEPIATTVAAAAEENVPADASNGCPESFGLWGTRSRRGSLLMTQLGPQTTAAHCELGERQEAADWPEGSIQAGNHSISRRSLVSSASTAAGPARSTLAAGGGQEYGRSFDRSKRSSCRFSRTGSVINAAMAARATNFAALEPTAAAANFDAHKQCKGDSEFKASRMPGSLGLQGLAGSPASESHYIRASPTAAEAAARQPEGTGSRRSLDVPPKHQQPHQQQLYTASSLAAVGLPSDASAAKGNATTPSSPTLKSPVKPLSLLKAYSSPAPLISDSTAVAGNFNRCQSNHPDRADSGSETSRYLFKPFVPPIDLIDRHARQHAAESDCTAYHALLETLHDIQQH